MQRFPHARLPQQPALHLDAAAWHSSTHCSIDDPQLTLNPVNPPLPRTVPDGPATGRPQEFWTQQPDIENLHAGMQQSIPFATQSSRRKGSVLIAEAGRSNQKTLTTQSAAIATTNRRRMLPPRPPRVGEPWPSADGPLYGVRRTAVKRKPARRSAARSCAPRHAAASGAYSARR